MNFLLVMKISMGSLLGLFHEEKIKILPSTPQSVPQLLRISKGPLCISKLFCDCPSPHFFFIALTAVFKWTAGYISYQNVILLYGTYSYTYY